MSDVYTATGRRKESVARVRIKSPGTGKQVVNGRPLDAYFGRRNLKYQNFPDFRPIPTLESASGIPPECSRGQEEKDESEPRAAAG